MNTFDRRLNRASLATYRLSLDDDSPYLPAKCFFFVGTLKVPQPGPTLPWVACFGQRANLRAGLWRELHATGLVPPATPLPFRA